MPVAQPTGLCLWQGYIANCPVAEALTSFGLASGRNTGELIKIPYREAVREKYGVVACISPQFCAERWQLIIHMLEIYRQYGVDLQVYYFESMLAEIYDFMKVYEKLGIVAFEAFAKISVDARSLEELDYDPNQEVEIRNQPTAYNDCLMKYKLAAEFIIFGDTDDILYPRYADTYLEEFRQLAARYPSGGAFLYTRYNANFLTSMKPLEYSISAMIKDIHITPQWVSEKYVAIPSRVKASYIHWPALLEETYNFTKIPIDINMMIHLRRWRTVDRHTGYLPKYLFKVFRKRIKDLRPYDAITDLISTDKINLLELNFREFLRDNNAEQLFYALPEQIRYYPILEQCNHKMLYGRNTLPDECVGHIQCPVIPVRGVLCATVNPDYKHLRVSSKLVVHHALGPTEIVVKSDGCEF